ncbi:MAG: Bug family tripartite tricarboxylate transporter substrate binding protein, partial [Steroidobacteraceae bacterium]
SGTDTMARSLTQLQVLLVAGLLWQPCGAIADPIADFYRQKTVTFLTVYAPGGSYDLYGRLIATHLPRFIPGNPKVVVQYLPGAGGLNGAMRLANQSPKDGTEIGMPDRGIAVNQVLSASSVPLDASKFNWIGSVSNYDGIVQVAAQTGVKNADDLRRIPVVMGSWGVETSSYTLPVLLNALAGMKFKVVTGYRGAAEVDLAIEGGEVEGRISSWVTLKYLKPALLADGKVVVVLQSGVKRNPDLPQVPLIDEVATSEQGRRILAFIDSDTAIGWSVIAPPGVPPERVAALRQAFDEMVKDPKFLADANARHLDVRPSSGPELEALINRTLSIPKEDVAAMNKLLATKK